MHKLLSWSTKGQNRSVDSQVRRYEQLVESSFLIFIYQSVSSYVLRVEMDCKWITFPLKCGLPGVANIIFLHIFKCNLQGSTAAPEGSTNSSLMVNGTSHSEKRIKVRDRLAWRHTLPPLPSSNLRDISRRRETNKWKLTISCCITGAHSRSPTERISASFASWLLLSQLFTHLRPMTVPGSRYFCFVYGNVP